MTQTEPVAKLSKYAIRAKSVRFVRQAVTANRPTRIFTLRHHWSRNTRAIRRRQSVCAYVLARARKTRWKYTGLGEIASTLYPATDTHTQTNTYAYICVRITYGCAYGELFTCLDKQFVIGMDVDRRRFRVPGRGWGMTGPESSDGYTWSPSPSSSPTLSSAVSVGRARLTGT